MHRNDLSNIILLWTDGACSGNPGRGGYGVVLVDPGGHVEELGKGEAETTNNRMEMSAIIRGLAAIGDAPHDIWVLTDSTYAIRGITQWVHGWRKKGWVTAEGNPVNNQDLWEKLDGLVKKRKKFGKIEWKYVRGHSNIPANERCDEIAVGFTKGKYVDLYSGSLLEYPVAVHDFPEDMSLPPMSEKKEKKPAYSYLSYVNGVLERHSTWPECEAKVKGRSGAKFKKATSKEDEVRIFEEWKINPKKWI